MTPTLITYHETSCYHMVSVSALFPPVGCLPSYIVPWFPSSLTHYRELLNSDTISSLIETSSGFLRPQTNHGTNTGSQAPNGLAFADAQLHSPLHSLLATLIQLLRPPVCSSRAPSCSLSQVLRLATSSAKKALFQGSLLVCFSHPLDLSLPGSSLDILSKMTHLFVLYPAKPVYFLHSTNYLLSYAYSFSECLPCYDVNSAGKGFCLLFKQHLESRTILGLW